MDSFLWCVASNVSLAGLLAVVACLAGWTIRNPHLTHGLWVLVLIKLLMPPIFGVSTPWLRDSTSPSPALPDASQSAAVSLPDNSIESMVNHVETSPSKAPTAPLEPKPSLHIPTTTPELSISSEGGHPLMSWQQGVVILWGLGTIVSLGWVLVRCLRFRRFLNFAKPADEILEREVQDISRQMGLSRPPEVCLLDAVFPPLLWGIFRFPKVLLPRQLVEGLSLQQRQTVLAHELAHLRRRDHLFRWIEVSVLVLYWWCPIAWWASRRLRHAEEECCDALVLSTLPQSRQPYGEALYKTIEFLAEHRVCIPKIVAGTFGTNPVKRRIEMIMTQPIRRRMTWKTGAVCGLVAMITLPLVAENTRPPAASEDHPKRPQHLTAEQSTPAEQSTKTKPPSTDALPDRLPQFEEGKIRQFTAILEPISDVKLSSLHSGTVSKVHVSEGDRVKKGQVLLELKNTEIEIRYQDANGELKVQQERTKAANVAVRLAKAKLATANRLHQEALNANKRIAGAITETRLKDLASGIEQAQLNLEKAELDAQSSALSLASLEQHTALAARVVQELTIKAPIDGVLVEVDPKVGELVKINDPVARIVNLTNLAVESYIPSSVEGVGKLMGKPVIVDIPASPGESLKLPAKVTFVSPIIDPITQQFKIRCVFKNTGADGQLLVRPGQSAILIVPRNP